MLSFGVYGTPELKQSQREQVSCKHTHMCMYTYFVPEEINLLHYIASHCFSSSIFFFLGKHPIWLLWPGFESSVCPFGENIRLQKAETDVFALHMFRVVCCLCLPIVCEGFKKVSMPFKDFTQHMGASGYCCWLAPSLITLWAKRKRIQYRVTSVHLYILWCNAA